MAVVLGILILLLVILLIPVRVSAGASSGKAPHAVLRWLFLSIPLFPRPKRKKTQDKSESSKPGKKKEKPKRSLKPLLAELLARFDRLSRPVQRLLRRTGLARVSLRLVVKGEDAAATALRFGRANAAVYSTVAALDRIFSLRVEQIEIIPGFAAEQEEYSCSGEIRLFPLAVFIAALQLGFWTLIALIRSAGGRDTNENRRAQPARRKEEYYGKQASHQ